MIYINKQKILTYNFDLLEDYITTNIKDNANNTTKKYC